MYVSNLLSTHINPPPESTYLTSHEICYRIKNNKRNLVHLLSNLIEKKQQHQPQLPPSPSNFISLPSQETLFVFNHLVKTLYFQKLISSTREYRPYFQKNIRPNQTLAVQGGLLGVLKVTVLKKGGTKIGEVVILIWEVRKGSQNHHIQALHHSQTCLLLAQH